MRLSITPPSIHHIAGLIQLSENFARQYEWASQIPVGQITTPEAATAKLFGSEVVALVAETSTGELAGFVGIYAEPGAVYASLLVSPHYQRQGVARRLVEAAFQRAPSGLNVEAWVGEFNQVSLAVTPKLGFTLNKIIDHAGWRIFVFVRPTLTDQGKQDSTSKSPSANEAMEHGTHYE